MPSRLQSLISRGALVMLASLAMYACDVTDDDQLREPPPVPPGTGKVPAGGTGSTLPAGMIASGTSTTPMTGTMKAAALTDAGSGKASSHDADMDDADSGLRRDAGSSLGGRGTAGMLAADSGGRGAGGTGGSAGAVGEAGAAGGSTSPECLNQFCFTQIDCWLLDEANCNYTNCVNFTCQ